MASAAMRNVSLGSSRSGLPPLETSSRRAGPRRPLRRRVCRPGATPCKSCAALPALWSVLARIGGGSTPERRFDRAKQAPHAPRSCACDGRFSKRARTWIVQHALHVPSNAVGRRITLHEQFVGHGRGEASGRPLSLRSRFDLVHTLTELRAAARGIGPPVRSSGPNRYQFVMSNGCRFN